MEWWKTQPDGCIGTCLPVRLGTLRMLTNKVAMNGAPVSPEIAIKAWRTLSDDPRTYDVTAAPRQHEANFVSLLSGRQPTPNLWTDMWLAALAITLDCEFITFDRGFRSFPGLKLRLLQIPAQAEG
jgi:predicted nucleic acid-binding protein